MEPRIDINTHTGPSENVVDLFRTVIREQDGIDAEENGLSRSSDVSGYELTGNDTIVQLFPIPGTDLTQVLVESASDRGFMSLVYANADTPITTIYPYGGIPSDSPLKSFLEALGITV